MKTIIIAAGILLAATPAHGRGAYHFWWGGFYYSGPLLSSEDSVTYSTRGVYRESPAEADARLRDTEQRCQPGIILYSRPENAARAEATARRCGAR